MCEGVYAYKKKFITPSRFIFHKLKDNSTRWLIWIVFWEPCMANFLSIKLNSSDQYPLNELPFSQLHSIKLALYNWQTKFRWIIDPVDGTTNFVHGFPYVAVCIGFSINKKVQCSVVFNPILDEMFHAKINSGAFLNQNKISVNQTTSISKSLLLSGWDGQKV